MSQSSPSAWIEEAVVGALRTPWALRKQPVLSKELVLSEKKKNKALIGDDICMESCIRKKCFHWTKVFGSIWRGRLIQTIGWLVFVFRCVYIWEFWRQHCYREHIARTDWRCVQFWCPYLLWFSLKTLVAELSSFEPALAFLVKHDEVSWIRISDGTHSVDVRLCKVARKRFSQLLQCLKDKHSDLV